MARTRRGAPGALTFRPPGVAREPAQRPRSTVTRIAGSPKAMATGVPGSTQPGSPSATIAP